MDASDARRSCIFYPANIKPVEVEWIGDVTILEVRTLIASELNISVDLVHILISGKIVADGERLVADCGILRENIKPHFLIRHRRN